MSEEPDRIDLLEGEIDELKLDLQQALRDRGDLKYRLLKNWDMFHRISDILKEPDYDQEIP